MKASRPTIIEVRGSRLGLDIKGPRPRARPGSAAQMSDAGSRDERTSRARPQPASAAARSGRTTLLSRPRSAERPVSASAANARRPGPVPARADRPCTAAPRSVKTGPNSRRPRKPRDGAGCETVVKHIAGSSSSSGGGGDAAGRTGHSTGDQTSCGCSTSSLSRWTSSAEPGAPRRKGVTFSDTLSTDTAAAAGSATAGTARATGATGATSASAAAVAAAAATSEDAAAGSDSSDTSPSELARRRVAARPLPAAAATDELTRELLARGQQLRQGMARLIARQMDRSGGSLTPPDSELEARLAHMGVNWDTQTRATGGADRPSAAAPSAAAAALRAGLSGRPRTAFTLPSESSTSGPAGASVSAASAVPPLNLPPSLMSSRERAQRRPPAAAVHSPRRQVKTANMTDRLPLLRKASFLRISIDSLSFDPVFVRSVSSAPDAADTRVYLEYELPLETGATARRSTRLGGKRIATETPLSHRSVLPVRLTAAGVRLWQASELQLTALGQAGGRCWTLAVAALPLRQLLRQPRLTLSKRLALTLRAAGRPLVGHVRVRLELGSDRDDFPAALAAGEHGKRRRKLRRLQPASGDSCSEDTIDEESEDGERSEEEDAREDARDEDSRPVSQEDDRRVRTEPCLVSDAEKEPARLPAPTSERSGATEAGSKVRLVHWAVRVGGGTPSVPGALRNTYLVVRAPWLQQAATSVTCWAEERPQYDYTLISPVLLTAPLVARLHNNLLVVEVWQRSQAPGQDRLVGLSRLPLERLYLTFSQPDVTDTVLQMKSPVLVHDGSVSVHHPATDTTPAQLELTLAAGTQQQVDAWMAPQRDRPTRDKPPASASERVSCDCTMQLRLGRLLHVPDINEARSGEVDCFVQYTWPVQDDSGDLRLRSFSTEPAISRVNPPLSHEARHVYRAPSGGHVADALVAACAPDGGARWDVVVRTFYPVVRDRVIARGVLSSSQIFGLVEACGADGRQNRTFAVPLQLLAGGDDPAHPSLEVSLIVETAPVSVGSRTELSSSGGVGAGVEQQQLPTWTEVIAARSSRSRTAAAAGAGRTGVAADGFEADPQSELELRRPVREVRETPVSRRHTWVCGDGGWAERPGRSPVPVTREEGSQTDLESQAAASREALSQAGDSSPVSQLAPSDSQHAESRTAPSHDPRHSESRTGGDSRPDGGSSGSEDSLDRRSGGEHAENVDSEPSSESEMLRRLRRPLGAPPAAERPPVVPAPVPAAASVSVTSAGGSSAGRTAADRADILSDIERDLERLRRTGSIFSGQRRATGPVDDTTQTDDLPVDPVPTQAPTPAAATTRPVEVAAVAERDAGPAERGGGGDAARGRSWSPPPAAAAECRSSEFADVSLLEPVDLSKGRGEQHVMHVSTEAVVERGRFLPTTAATAAVGRRGSPAVSSSEAATPATRAASSLENAPVSNGRTVVTSYHARDARDAPSRDAPSRDASSSVPSRVTGRTGSLAETATSSAGRPTSRADSWVSAVTPATRPVSPGPPSPSTAPRPPVSGGDGDGEGAFRAQLTVVEALHLPRIVRGEKREQPRVFVSVQTPAGAVSSPLETGTRPRWNWSQTVWIGRELLQQEFHYLVLKVWHRSTSGRDRVLGLVLIDLVPLLHGLNELLGWYNIVDLAGVCRGQMKLSLRPLDDVPCVERESLDLSVSLDDPDRASYVTTSWHSAFPSHLTRYPELAIRAVNRAHHKRDTPLELSPRPSDAPDPSSGGGRTAGGGGGRGGSGSGGSGGGGGGGGGRGSSDAQLSEELLQRLLPAEDECELMDGTRSFLASVLRKNLEDLDSLRDGLLRRVEPDWTRILPMHANHAVQNLCTSSGDRSGCSSRSGQVRSRSPHTAGGTGQGHAHGRRASEPDAKSARGRVDSRTYTSLTNGGGHWDSGSAATSIADKENHQSSASPPPPRRPTGDPGESYVFVRAMNDVSSGNYASEVFCHRREVRGGPTDGTQVTSAPVGRFFSEQETAELRRRGSGASGPDSRADGGGGSGGGGGELPSSVVDLIETAVRRSAELCEPPPPASSDSDSLPFGDNLRSLNDTSEESDRGAPTSHAELFISILQEMEARDGPPAPVSSSAPGRPPDEGTVALGAILARDMSRLTAAVTHPSAGSGGGGSALEPAVEHVERRTLETAMSGQRPDREQDRGPSVDRGPSGGVGGASERPPETVGGGDCAPSPHLLTWRDDVSSDGRRSARRRRLAAALDMR